MGDGENIKKKRNSRREGVQGWGRERDYGLSAEVAIVKAAASRRTPKGRDPRARKV